MTALLLLAPVLVPLLLLGAAALAPALWPRLPGLLWLVPLPGLLAALLGSGMPTLVLDPGRLRFTFGLDRPSALLLGAAALLWSAAGPYAASWLRANPGGAGEARFCGWWLLTLSGSLGVFLAGDLASFYLTYALASLSAFGLVVHDGTRRARRAAAIYLLLAVLGEVFLLLAFALLAEGTPGDSIAIADILAALPGSPARGLAVALLLAGFGLKAGLVPLHVALPIAYPAAPFPGAAVLAGAVVKAGLIGLLRFLPAGGTLPDWGMVLAVLGLASAFYGAGIGLTQRDPKAVLAYSSISQMGFVLAALGLGVAAGDAATPMAVAFYAAHHVLAKGGLFLALGVAAVAGARGGRGMGLVVLPALLVGLGFAGLPPTGGALAKAAVKEMFGTGLAAGLAALAATGSTLLMLHFVQRLVASAAPAEAARPAPAGLLLPWLGIATATLVLPWALFAACGLGAPLAALLDGGALWKALWPVLLGALLWLGLRRLQGRLGLVPEGDVIALAGPAGRGLGRVADGLERAERALRAWPAAGLVLLSVAVALGAAMLAAG